MNKLWHLTILPHRSSLQHRPWSSSRKRCVVGPNNSKQSNQLSDPAALTHRRTRSRMIHLWMRLEGDGLHSSPSMRMPSRTLKEQFTPQHDFWKTGNTDLLAIITTKFSRVTWSTMSWALLNPDLSALYFYIKLFLMFVPDIEGPIFYNPMWHENVLGRAVPSDRGSTVRIHCLALPNC